jgi:hypothetical protein
MRPFSRSVVLLLKFHNRSSRYPNCGPHRAFAAQVKRAPNLARLNQVEHTYTMNTKQPRKFQNRQPLAGWLPVFNCFVPQPAFLYHFPSVERRNANLDSSSGGSDSFVLALDHGELS